MGSPYAQKILLFFCGKCGKYEEKSSPRYRAQKQRAYRARKKRESEQSAAAQQSG